MFLWMTCLTGLIYPLLVTLLAQTMAHQANGSFLYRGETIVGSSLIAQKFEGSKYFWPRPSSIDYNPMPSGGSNLGPTSAALKKSVEERGELLKTSVPEEMLYASASGVDPHISLSTAYFQMQRVAEARGLELNVIKALIDAHRQGFFGEPYVNVLLLNRDLDLK